MLCFDNSTVTDRSGTWACEDGRWVGPAGWVRPFDHPALVAEAVVDGPRLRPTVAERCENVDFVRLEVDDRAVSAQAGALGQAPVYVRFGNGGLLGSLRMADLMDSLPFGAVNGRELRRLLTRRRRFSADTMFADIWRLTDRAWISAGTEGLRLSYLDLVENSSSRRALTSGVDPVAVLGDLIGRHLEGRHVDVVELSGGIDSALMAAEITRSSDHQMRSFGLLMSGEQGTG